MAGGNFMHRVISYVVNEVIVNGLANRNGLFLIGLLPEARSSQNLLFHGQCKTPYTVSCPAFQRFAVRTSRRIEDISSKAAQKREELAEQMKDFSKNFDQQSRKQ